MTRRVDISNQRFGKTVALEPLPKSMWRCLCDCGAVHETHYGRLVSGQTQSCGCKRRDRMHAYRSQFKAVDLAGQRFGRLVAVSVAEREKRRHVRWLCRCDCGNEKIVSSHNLTGGSTQSCGCLRVERTTTHGRFDSPEWHLFTNSKARAREMGIEHSLTLEDIVIPEFCPLLGIRLERGSKSHHDASPSIDRINSDLGYTKENTWVVSMRANKIKNSASFAEFMQIASNWWSELDRRLGKST